MKKKFISLFLFAVFMASCFFGFDTYALSNVVEGGTQIEAESFDSSSSLTTLSGYLNMTAGGWASYNLNVEVGSTYSFSIAHLRLAADTANGSAEIGVYVDDVLAKTVTFTTVASPATNTLAGVELTAGQHTLKLQVGSERGYRINYLKLINARTNVSKMTETRIPAVYFADSTVTSAPSTGGATGGVISNDGNLTVVSGKYATYDINVQKAGVYKLSVCAGTSTSSLLNVYDGSNNSLCSGTIEACPPKTPPTDVDPYRYGKINEIGTFNLSAGISKIKVVFAGGAYLYSVILKRIGSIGETTVSDTNITKIEAEDYNLGSLGCEVGGTGEVVSLGSVKEELDFDLNVLTGGNYEMSICYSKEDTKNSMLKVLSRQNKIGQVSLAITGNKDTYQNIKILKIPLVAGKNTISFNVPDSRIRMDYFELKGISTINLTNVAIHYRDVDISGKMESSVKDGIKGKQVNLYLQDTKGDLGVEPILSAILGDDGDFDFKYSLPISSICGMYTFILDCEDLNEQMKLPLSYVSEELEGIILNKFKLTTNATDVKTLFETYESEAGLLIATDMGNVPDRDKVYEYFIGKTFNAFAALREMFYSVIALETFNQATVSDTVAGILQKSETYSYFGIEKGKVDLIVDKRSEFIAEILALPVISSQTEFSTVAGEVVDKWLMLEYGKNDVSLKIDNKSIYAGQGIELDIDFTAEQSNVEKVILVVTSDDTSFSESIATALDIDATTTISKNDGKVIIEIVPQNLASVKALLGKFVLTALDSSSEYKINIIGKVQYNLGLDYAVVSNILHKEITVTVTQNNTSLGGEKTRTDNPSKIFNKPVTPTPVTPEPAKDVFEFKDLDSVNWAKESITALLKSGVISESKDNNFNPNDNITREEFVKLVVVALNLEDKLAKSKLSDVMEGQWYYPYIASAEKSGLVTGNENGMFIIGGKITREDMSVIIQRAISLSGVDLKINGSELFNDDTDISGYAKDAVYLLRSVKIISGTGDNKLMPKDYATRAMATKMIFEMIKVVG